MTAAANAPLAAMRLAELRTALRDFARGQLPEAMVPGRFVILDELPRLPNGKVDRGRLPSDPGERAPAAGHVAPRTPDEARIAGIWRDVLGVGAVGVADSFFELGGDSLTAAQLVARVRAAYEHPLSVRSLFEHPTVAELAGIVAGRTAVTVPGAAGSRSLSAEALAAEARLPADVAPEPGAAPPATPPYRTVLLTGGTGYTGAFLVRELLDRSRAEVMVLARAGDAGEASHRVRRTMVRYGVWRDGDEGRVSGVPGDLARPYLGLSRADYLTLAERVEMIVHNGALSSYALPYRSLKAVNVLGTLEVLRLACRRRVKPAHVISSLAVFPGDPGAHRYPEAELEDPAGVVGGYRQTKWVADRLTTLAGRAGLPVCVYRPGLITGAGDTGACATDTFLNAAIKGCIQLGAALEFDVTLEMTPVDFCARAVAHVALGGAHHGATFNLPGARTVTWSEVVDMIAACGYPLRRERYAEWYRALTDAVEGGVANELSRFLPLFDERGPAPDLGYEGSHPSFGTERLDAALAGSGIERRPVDQGLLATYLDYFAATGFLPAPTGRRPGARYEEDRTG
jgi:thioester reductase-like protein